MAAFGGFGLLFILLRRNVAPAYSIAVSMMAAMMATAGYHYFRIFESRNEAFVHQAQGFVPTRLPFSHGYRYAD